MARCWMCEGSGTAREARNGYAPGECSECGGTGLPETLAEQSLRRWIEAGGMRRVVAELKAGAA